MIINYRDVANNPVAGLDAGRDLDVPQIGSELAVFDRESGLRCDYRVEMVTQILEMSGVAHAVVELKPISPPYPIIGRRPEPCAHLADSDQPAPNLMPRPCPRCGRYYVNDDNSEEREPGQPGDAVPDHVQIIRTMARRQWECPYPHPKNGTNWARALMLLRIGGMVKYVLDLENAALAALGIERARGIFELEMDRLTSPARLLTEPEEQLLRVIATTPEMPGREAMIAAATRLSQGELLRRAEEIRNKLDLSTTDSLRNKAIELYELGWLNNIDGIKRC